MSAIILELRSDMCAASGRGYSHIVDTDICTDTYGLPMIPARRLKGCLRDAAIYYGIAPEIIDALFGRTGSAEPGALCLENGYLSDRDALIGEGKLPAPDAVTQIYTGLRVQSAIDPATGTARAESLRSTRVVHEYLPYDDHRRTSFVFRADCPPQYAEPMETICKALRSMGSGRTRGLGAVRAVFRYEAPASTAAASAAADATPAVLPIHIRLRAPLLLPDSSNTLCSDHISGTMLRGALAGLWCRKHPDSDPALFDDLFFRGRVSYSNLYISDASGSACEPMPGCVGRIKDPNGALDERKLYIKFDRVEAPPQMKPLRGVFANAALEPQEIRREETFHHVHSGDKLLYTQMSISADQYYYGTITGPRCLLEELRRATEGETLRLGRSRTAQYAACELIPAQIYAAQPADPERDILQYGVFTLVSDAILYDENGVNTCDPQALIDALLPGMNYTVNDLGTGSAINTKTIRGYNAKRGLREMPRIAFAMGSTLCVELRESDLDRIENEYTIGEHTAEGFGRVHFRTDMNIMECVEALDPESAHDEGTDPDSRLQRIIDRSNAGSACVKRGMQLFEQHRDSCKEFTPSFIGRAILMTQQARGDELERRIRSVKDKDKSKQLLSLYEMTANEADQRAVLLTILRMCRISLKGAKKHE